MGSHVTHLIAVEVAERPTKRDRRPSRGDRSVNVIAVLALSLALQEWG